MDRAAAPAPAQSPCARRRLWQGCGWSWATARKAPQSATAPQDGGRKILCRQSLSCAIKGSQTNRAQTQPQTFLPAQQQKEWKCLWSLSCLSCRASFRYLSPWPIQGQSDTICTQISGHRKLQRDLPRFQPGSPSTSSASPRKRARTLLLNNLNLK